MIDLIDDGTRGIMNTKKNSDNTPSRALTVQIRITKSNMTTTMSKTMLTS
jgi:hypothetical protein